MIYPFGVGRNSSARTAVFGISGIALRAGAAVAELLGLVSLHFQGLGSTDSLAALRGATELEAGRLGEASGIAGLNGIQDDLRSLLGEIEDFEDGSS